MKMNQHPFFAHYFMNFYYFFSTMHFFGYGKHKSSDFEKSNNAIQQLTNFEQYYKEGSKQDQNFLVGLNAKKYLIYRHHFEINPLVKMFRLLQLIRIQTVDMFFRKLALNTFSSSFQHMNSSNEIRYCLEYLKILKIHFENSLILLEILPNYNSVILNFPHKGSFGMLFKPYLEHCMSEFDKFHQSMQILKHSNDSIIANLRFRRINPIIMKEHFTSCLKNVEISTKTILKEFPESI